MKVEEMSSNIFGEKVDELYECKNCEVTHPNGTEARQVRTLININKFMIIQLKMFGYDQSKQELYKIVPKLKIEEQVTSILLGKLNLRAIVYHIGNSPVVGHYVASVKRGDTW